MKLTSIAMVVFSGLLPMLQAQQPAVRTAAADACAVHPSAAFDVSTVRPSDKSAGGSSMHRQADSLTTSGVLRRLILFAFDLSDFQVTGGPDWVNTQVWEISAKMDTPDADPFKLDEASQQALIDRERERVQSLLAERFQFKCHIAPKELAIYELVAAKAGAKLTATTAATEKQHSMSSNGNGHTTNLVATGIGMGDAIRFLSSQVGRRVVDKTGLTGNYDMTLTWMPAMASTSDADATSGPTIFTALEEQLGLKLVPAKGPVPVLVIDAVEKPSEN